MARDITFVNQSNLYPGLSTADAHVLIDRAVSPDVAAMRGYRTVTAEQAQESGFSPSQARSGLEIPRRNTQGIIDDCAQLRPRMSRASMRRASRLNMNCRSARGMSWTSPPGLSHISRPSTFPF